MKSRTSSNFGQIGPLTTELAALERLKISHRLIMGKCCLHASSFMFYRIIIKAAGNQDRHKSSDEFDLRPDQNSVVHGNRKPPFIYNGENGVSTFPQLLLIRSSNGVACP